MRKLAFINIIFIYLLLSVGVVKSTHYCMGKVKDVEYFSILADGCSPFDQRTMPCCQDELEYLSIEDDHQSQIFSKSFFNSYIALIPEYFLLEINSLIHVNDEYSVRKLPDPPDLFSIPIYITSHQFTFYG